MNKNNIRLNIIKKDEGSFSIEHPAHVPVPVVGDLINVHNNGDYHKCIVTQRQFSTNGVYVELRITLKER